MIVDIWSMYRERTLIVEKSMSLNETVQCNFVKSCNLDQVVSFSESSKQIRERSFIIPIFNRRFFTDSHSYFTFSISNDPPLFISKLDIGNDEEKNWIGHKSIDHIFWSNKFLLSINKKIADFFLLTQNRICIVSILFQATGILVITLLWKVFDAEISFRVKTILGGLFIVICAFTIYHNWMIFKELNEFMYEKNISAVMRDLERKENLIPILTLFEENQGTRIAPSPNFLSKHGIQEIFIGKKPIFEPEFIRLRINNFIYIYILNTENIYGLKLASSGDISFSRLSDLTVWSGVYWNYVESYFLLMIIKLWYILLVFSSAGIMFYHFLKRKTIMEV